jgi:hypothetical protein
MRVGEEIQEVLSALTMPQHLVHPGDRYLRHGNPPSTWVVERLIERPDHPLHVILVQEGYSRTVTIAVSVLGDERQFRKIDDGG